MPQSFDLDLTDPAAGKHPYKTVAKIAVHSETQDKEGVHYITCECTSIEEFEKEIDRLEEELRQIREAAQEAFANGD